MPKGGPPIVLLCLAYSSSATPSTTSGSWTRVLAGTNIDLWIGTKLPSTSYVISFSAGSANVVAVPLYGVAGTASQDLDSSVTGANPTVPASPFSQTVGIESLLVYVVAVNAAAAFYILDSSTPGSVAPLLSATPSSYMWVSVSPAPAGTYSLQSNIYNAGSTSITAEAASCLIV